jgi:hypothetical protein
MEGVEKATAFCTTLRTCILASPSSPTPLAISNPLKIMGEHLGRNGLAHLPVSANILPSRAS